MNAATAFTRSSFRAWLLSPGDKLAHSHEVFHSTLPEIEGYFSAVPYFGAMLFILEHDAVKDARTLHAYRIRRGKWAGGRDYSGCKYFPHKADKLFSLPVDGFDPTEPWSFTRGRDVVGAGDGVIEGVAR